MSVLKVSYYLTPNWLNLIDSSSSPLPLSLGTSLGPSCRGDLFKHKWV